MDLSKDVVLKENYTFLVADAGGQITGGEHGLYNRDTRFLNSYAWRFGEGFETLLAHAPRPDHFEAHYALIKGPSQLVGVGRRLELSARGLLDTLTLENTSLKAAGATPRAFPRLGFFGYVRGAGLDGARARPR